MARLTFEGDINQIQGELLFLARIIDGGNQVLRAQELQRKANQAGEAARREVLEGDQPGTAEPSEPGPPAAPRRGRPKKAEAETVNPAPAPAETPQADAGEVPGFLQRTPPANDNTPLPKNADELRAMFNGLAAKKSPKACETIIRKYAPKISQIPVEKYAEVVADINAALSAA